MQVGSRNAAGGVWYFHLLKRESVTTVNCLIFPGGLKQMKFCWRFLVSGTSTSNLIYSKASICGSFMLFFLPLLL